MSDVREIRVLDHGFVRLRNISGPTRRVLDDRRPFEPLLPDSFREFDADDRDPANAARLSLEQGDFGTGGREYSYEADMKLNEYLLINEHSSPIEMIQVWIEVMVPIFIDRQMVRHRTWRRSESSARYVVLPELWYVPTVEDTVLRAKDIKQGGKLVDTSDPEQVRIAQEDIRDLQQACQLSWDMYQRSIARGIAMEQARMRLHLNHYVHWLGNVDLHNLFHFLRLRAHSHAQLQNRRYAEAIVQLLRPHLPGLMTLFDKHCRKPETSR